MAAAQAGRVVIRAQLRAYYDAACQRGGHTPHILQEALAWHVRYQETQSMLAAQ